MAFGARARAGGFAFTTVLNDETVIDGSLTFEGTAQVVAGNGGVVATSSFFNDDAFSAITYNGTNGSSATQIIARDDNLGGSGKILNDYDPSSSASFLYFSELSLSQSGQTKITFLSQDYNLDFGLFQANIDANTFTTIQHLSDYTLQTDTTDQELFNIHQQVNDAGQVVYGIRRLSDDQQAIGVSGSVLLSELDPTAGNLKDFNTTAATQTYKRLAIAADGSVVFRATNDTDGTIGIYRSTNLNFPIVGGLAAGVTGAVSDQAVVVAASNNSVLYTDVDSTNSVTSLTLANSTSKTTIVSYATANNFAHNAVMTQGERVAFYAPVDPSGEAVVGYYRAGYNNGAAKLIAVDNSTVITDGGRDYTVSQISTVDYARNTVPMVNDKGTVVFDTDLVTDNNSTVQALVVWQESTGTAEIVVKTNDGTDTNPDSMYEGHPITAIAVDSGTNQAGDVLKDGLSDDNWLAFGITYEIDGIDHQAVIETFIPEPTALASTGVIAGVVALKRRRRTSTQ